jgi:hypothetical protein
MAAKSPVDRRLNFESRCRAILLDWQVREDWVERDGHKIGEGAVNILLDLAMYKWLRIRSVRSEYTIFAKQKVQRIIRIFAIISIIGFFLGL